MSESDRGRDLHRRRLQGQPRAAAAGAPGCAPASTRRNCSAASALTTNNRMELTAVIEALAALKRRCDVTLYTDSQYVRNGITEWIHGWKPRGWKTADKQAGEERRPVAAARCAGAAARMSTGAGSRATPATRATNAPMRWPTAACAASAPESGYDARAGQPLQCVDAVEGLSVEEVAHLGGVLGIGIGRWPRPPGGTRTRHAPSASPTQRRRRPVPQRARAGAAGAAGAARGGPVRGGGGQGRGHDARATTRRPSGSLRSRQGVMLRPEVSGRIAALGFSDGAARAARPAAGAARRHACSRPS